MSSRRLRAVKILAVLLPIPVLGAVGAYVWINRVADRRWAAAESRMHQLTVAFPEGDARRSPENPSAASKDNQIHFVAAIRGAAPKRLRQGEAWDLILQRAGGDAVDSILDDAQDFLDRLHQGARRIAASPADFPSRWNGDWDFVTLTYMMHCAILRARQQRAHKAPFEAAETLLDSLQLGRFWAISGKGFNRVYALGTMSNILEDLRDLLASEPLAPDDLLRLERELETLDAAMDSPVRDLEPWLARWGEALASSDPRDMGVREDPPFPWRYLLPVRFLKAEAFEFMDRHVRRILEVESRGYGELRRFLRAVDEEALQSRNPIIRKTVHFDGDLAWNELERKAEFRLLRAAAHYRATGDFLKAEDPLGTVLLHGEAGTRMKFWSVGIDGKDDGGHANIEGSWYRSSLAPADWVANDIVLEVPRRP